MPTPNQLVTLFLRHVAQSRPHLHRRLAAHRRDLHTIVDRRQPDDAREEAILRVGAVTIDVARTMAYPMGSSLGDERTRTDLALLHRALAIADDYAQPDWYRRKALAVAYGISVPIAAGLSHMATPGGLDIRIWRACGDRSWPGVCDDRLCLACLEHDRTRPGPESDPTSEPIWPLLLFGGLAVGGAAGISMLIAGLLGESRSR